MWFGMAFAALTGVEADPFIEPPDVVESLPVSIAAPILFRTD
jgi:hypothetical protein